MLKIAMLAFATGSASLLGLGAWTMHERGGFCGRHGGGAHAELVHRFIDFAVTEKLDEIDATAEQRQKVQEVKDRLLKEGHALREGKQELREELMALLAQDNPDPARVRALVRQRTDAFVRFADDATDALLELHGTFTPAQRAQLLADAREHMEGRGRR
jgi:Spy/CpxP family protein refolding chaperone